MKQKIFSSKFMLEDFNKKVVLQCVDYTNRRHTDCLNDTTFCSVVVTKELKSKPYTIWMIYEPEKHARKDIVYAEATTNAILHNFSFKDEYATFFDVLSDLIKLVRSYQFKVPQDEHVFDIGSNNAEQNLAECQKLEAKLENIRR